MTKPSFILAFESSCDDTSVAIVDTSYHIISNLISSQPEHEAFGGVLPELASRLHIKNILHLTDAVFRQSGLKPDDIDAVAVSINPGLIGSLIVGLSFAKSLAWSMGKPLITVNHILSHIFANFIHDPSIKPPFLALVVSGGHTELVMFETMLRFEIVGKTIDDAAGETFDKSAKILGLGFPGGPLIDKLAKDGNPDFIRFPRGLDKKGNYNFSYSGTKTAIMNHVRGLSNEELNQQLPHLAASIQEAIIAPLIKKSLAWARQHQIKDILLAGGVAANSALRIQIAQKAAPYGIKIHYPGLELCMDNASMVAAAAIPKFLAGQFAELNVNAFSQKGTRWI